MAPPPARPRVLIVDDDVSVRMALRLVLDDGHDVIEAGNGASALACLGRGQVDVMILDVLLPKMDGFQVLQKARTLDRPVPVIVISGINTSWTAATAMRLGAVDYLTKPFDDVQLLSAVAESLEPGERGRRPATAERQREPHVLLVALPVGMRATLALALDDRCRLEAAADLPAALTRLKHDQPDAIVLQVSEALRRIHPEPVSRLRREFPRGLIVAVATDDEPVGSARDAGPVTLLRGSVPVSALLVEIEASFHQPTPRSPQLSDLTRRVVDHLAQHYAQATVAGLGKTMRMAPYALSLRFRQETGRPLRTYVQALRLEAVKILLAETSERIDAIARRVGLHDASHLSRIFAAQVGCRPGVYRRRQQAPGPGPSASIDGAAGHSWCSVVEPPVKATNPFVASMIRVTGDERVAFDIAECTGELRPARFFDAVIADALREDDALGYSPSSTPLHAFTPAIEGYLAERGVSLEDGAVLITSGTSVSLGMLARTLAAPGDVVAVEHPTWHIALAAFAAAGLRVLAMPVDDQGMRVDLLEAALDKQRVRFVYVQPAFQNPTGASLSASRRADLLEVSRRLGVPIVEDDFAAELGYAKTPAPLRQADAADRVIYLKSFSKLLTPAMRIAIMVVPRAHASRLRASQHGLDPFPSGLAQAVLSRCLPMREFRTHVERVRGLLDARWQTLNGALETRMPRGVRWSSPRGGLCAWLEVPAPLTALQVLADAAQVGVGFTPGSLFCLDGSGQRGARVAFGATPPLAIERGVRHLARIIRERLRESGRSALVGATIAP